MHLAFCPFWRNLRNRIDISFVKTERGTDQSQDLLITDKSVWIHEIAQIHIKI